MTLEDWVREHTEELNAIIIAAVPNIDSLDFDERRLWVLNDEGLYNWARDEGVRFDDDDDDEEEER